MFLKYKLGLTILALYEIAAVMLLHCPNTCNAMFGLSFCSDSVLKYFVWCVAVPLVAFLIIMWIMEIIDKIRRRHSLLYKAKHAVKHMAKNIRDRVSEHVSSADMEKMITAALVVGLKKYSDRNPRARRVLNEIMDVAPNEIDTEYDEYDYAVYDDDSVTPKNKKSKPTKRKK